MRATQSVSDRYEPAEATGAFMPDGSWKEDAMHGERGPTHALVLSLVRQRLKGIITPEQAAAQIRSAHRDEAFICINQWETCDDWPFAWVLTSAESCVKYAGVKR